MSQTESGLLKQRSMLMILIAACSTDRYGVPGRRQRHRRDPLDRSVDDDRPVEPPGDRGSRDWLSAIG